MEDEFKKAIEKVKTKNPSDNEKLELYGLYKQINFGNNNESKPWSYQIEKSYKWQAWKNNKDLTKEQAMKLYIELVNKIN
jgi:diazepam-binding inhibitor (GABA receptor modulator, acyl-CoA-binding protein)